MTKPFDIADLEGRLKAQGLPAIESLAQIAVAQVFAWLNDSVALEAASNPLFEIAVPIIKALQPIIQAELVKIAPATPAS